MLLLDCSCLRPHRLPIQSPASSTQNLSFILTPGCLHGKLSWDPCELDAWHQRFSPRGSWSPSTKVDELPSEAHPIPSPAQQGSPSLIDPKTGQSWVFPAMLPALLSPRELRLQCCYTHDRPSLRANHPSQVFRIVLLGSWGLDRAVIGYRQAGKPSTHGEGHVESR